MKKIIFTFLSLFMICFAGYPRQADFGVKVGITSNYLHFNADGEKVQGEKTGTYFGFVYNYQVNKNFAIQPNLLGALKGAEIEGVKFRTWHIELPVNFLYTHNGFFIGGGPNFSYGQDALAKGGDLEPDGEVDMYSTGESPDFTFKRFDIGANLLMGYTFNNRVSISTTYTHGFTNLYKGPEEDFTIRSSNFGFALGYMFCK